MAFLVALGKLPGAEVEKERVRGQGMRNTREERHDQKRWMDEGMRTTGCQSRPGGRGRRRRAETRLGTATPERAINDSGAEFRDAEILSV